MSDNLSYFLVDLASNPNQMRAFLADPARVLDATSLSADERAAVLSRDSSVIRAAIEAGPGDPTGAAKGPSKKGSKKKGSKKKGSKKSNKKK